MKRELFDNVCIMPYENGGEIDRAGYLSAVVAFCLAGGGASAAVKVETSDVAGGEYAAVKDTKLFLDQPVDADGNAVIVNSAPVEGIANVNVDLVGCKRYIKVTVDGGEPVAVALGDPCEMPVGRDSIVYAEETTEAQQAIADAVNTIVGSSLKPSPSGCSVAVNGNSMKLTLTGDVSAVSGTGLIDTLTNVVAAGYTVSMDGTPIATVDDVKGSATFAKLAAMKAGDEDISSVITVTDSDGASVNYTLTVSYPA